MLKKSLQEIQENYFGFYQGVPLVLQHKQQLSGIVGAVAELIDVPADFTLAIEAALGGQPSMSSLKMKKMLGKPSRI